MLSHPPPAAVEASKEATDALKGAAREPHLGKNAQAAVDAAGALAALEAAELGVPSGAKPWPSQPTEHKAVPPGRAAELWGRVREAVKLGRVKKLLRSEKYDVVSAVFSALFPDDFDRVRPAA